MKQNITPYILSQLMVSQFSLLMVVILMMYLSQSVVTLYQKCKNTSSKYKPLSGSSYIKLSKELDHSEKGLINIQNINDITFPPKLEIFTKLRKKRTVSVLVFLVM